LRCLTWAADEIDRLKWLIRKHHNVQHIEEAARRGWGAKCPLCETAAKPTQGDES
jgi:hypothetical protein